VGQQSPGPGLQCLAPLVGEWQFETSIRVQPVVRGRAVFEWLEGGAFLIQHAKADPPLPTTPPEWRENSPFPVTAIIGCDDASGAFSYLYADGRGVRRVYQMSLADGVWSVWGQAGPQFFQRFIGTFRKDSRHIGAYWERSPDNIKWERDFDMLYTKIR
jgi:hypothetical protein